MKLTIPISVCLLVLLITSDWTIFNVITSRQVAAADQPAVKIHVHRNIAYADPKKSDKRMTSLDLFLPDKDSGQSGSSHPILIWIHGGAWSIGDKRAVQMKPKTFIGKGFIFVSINYRLFPMVDYADQAGDVAKSIHWVCDNVNKYGEDPKRIYIMGHSSGAHLAALVSTDDRYLKTEKLPLTTIKGVILLDGAGYDIPRQVNELAGPRNLKLFKTIFGSESETLKDASPINHISKNKGIPDFLILYVADRRNSKLQSEGLTKAFQEAGVSARVIAAENKTHATINREIGQPDDKPTQEIFKFLEELEK